MTTSRTTRRPSRTALRVGAAAEVALAVAAVLLDLLVPTLVPLAMAALTVLVRRERWAALGLTRPARPLRLAGAMLLLAALWSVAHLVLFMPVVERLTGQQQDTGDFTGLQGDAVSLALLLGLSWTLAAVGEEVAYRGYLLTRARQLLGASPLALVASVLDGLTTFFLVGPVTGLW